MNGALILIQKTAPRHWRSLAAVLLLVVAAAGINAVKPWPLKILVDDVLQGDALPTNLQWLDDLPGATTELGIAAWLAGGIVLAYVIGWIVQTAQSYLESGVGSRMTYDLGGKVFAHLQRLSLNYHSRRSAGDLLKRITDDSTCMRLLVIGVAVPALTALVSLIIMFVVMWQIHPWLSVVAIFVVLPLGVIMRVYFKPMADRTYEQQELEGQMLAMAEQTLTALPAIQSFGREDWQDVQFRNLTEHTLRAYLRAVSAQLKFNVGANTATALGTSTIMVLGGFAVLEESLSIGDLLIFIAYLGSLYAPLSTLSQLTSGYAAAAASARRCVEVLAVEDFPPEPESPRQLSAARSQGEITFEAVTFGYETGRPVLQSISLDIPAGKTLALVGHTGAGKSTLASLVPRLFDPWEGRVLLDGIDVRELRIDELRSQIALVPQESTLLPISIAENIAYGRPSASREQIQAAAKVANADLFVQRLPHGYDTVVGERGATLSGGERQRLAIARAVLKDPAILILDEPTSSLDAQTEALVFEALQRLTSGRTTLVIAHRLSTVERADSIVVLEHGQVVEQGTHVELVSAGGRYAQMWNTGALST